MKRRNWHDSAVTISLMVCVALSFLAFAFCVVVYVWRINQLSDFALYLKDSGMITDANLEWLKSLQAYYKDASNFNVINLIYVLIASVLTGLLGAYVQKQKEQVDKKTEQLEEIDVRIQKNSKQLSALEVSGTLLPKLLITLTHATTLYAFACNKAEVEESSFTINRLRDLFEEIKQALTVAEPLSSTGVTPLSYLLFSISDQLESANEKCQENGWLSFSKGTGDELIATTKKCLSLLEKAQIN